ncbi:MAG: metallophosphoesterase [Flavobacteriales bacterium]|nr:metallophosphoesterase [Flavobacteriales bacterium]MDW8409445.1 metallophosphoesterase [Flavobacteriales bacterium]
MPAGVCEAQKEPCAEYLSVQVLPVVERKSSLCVFHLTDLHVGQGLNTRDYGSPGWADSLSHTKGGYAAERLQKVVRRVNACVHRCPKSLVLISGDLTDSGEPSEFQHVREILDSLQAPWVPLLGNHDVWPYIRFGDEATGPMGDSILNVIFEYQFRKLARLFPFHEDQRHTFCQDGHSGHRVRLHNYSFTVEGRRFVCLDFNPRYHTKLSEPGIGPEAWLHPQPCGTWAFLSRQLEQAWKAGQRVTLVSHHPPLTLRLGKKQYAFTPTQRRQLLTLLRRYKGTVDSWLCGHFHRSARYRLPGTGIRVYETRANICSKNGVMRILKM